MCISWLSLTYITHCILETAHATELCRKHGTGQRTFCRWKEKYGNLEVSEAQWLRQPEEENGKLKQLIAEQALEVLRWWSKKVVDV